MCIRDSIHAQKSLTLLTEFIAGAERHLGLIDHEMLQCHADVYKRQGMGRIISHTST